MPDLSLNSQQVLLELARNSIKYYLEQGDLLSFKTDLPELILKRGCFVTLRKSGSLRGCVGTFDVSQVLYQNIIRMAVSSAFQDRRFESVTKNELDQIKIEISVLGELQKVGSIDEVEIGKHGVYVKCGNKTGTFLPDVAVEQKWLAVEFVTYCAREKAGLSPEECARAEIYRYEVEKFKE